MIDTPSSGRAERPDPLKRVTDRVLRSARRLSARRPRAGGLPGLLVALALFVGSTALAIRALPDFDQGIRLWPLVLIAVLAWVGALVNGAEFAVSARLLSRKVGARHAVRVAIVATAANTLPIPGAIIVRTRELYRLGETHTEAIKATAIVGLAMIGTSLTLAGGLQAALGPRRLVGAALSGVGLVLLAVVRRVMQTTARAADHGRLFWLLVIVELCSVGLKALTLGLAVYAIGFSASASQLATMSLSYVIALAIGVFPAGLGITELLVAIISPGVGVDAAVGVLATSVRRVTELVAFSGLAIAFTIRELSRATVEGASEAPAE